MRSSSLCGTHREVRCPVKSYIWSLLITQTWPPQTRRDRRGSRSDELNCLAPLKGRLFGFNTRVRFKGRFSRYMALKGFHGCQVLKGALLFITAERIHAGLQPSWWFFTLGSDLCCVGSIPTALVRRSLCLQCFYVVASQLWEHGPKQPPFPILMPHYLHVNNIIEQESGLGQH